MDILARLECIASLRSRKEFARNLAVIEVNDILTENLVVFMPFARYDNQVPRLCHGNCRTDRFALRFRKRSVVIARS